MLTTRAPCAIAMACEPSVLPLSAISTSPAAPLRARYDQALSIHRANVLDSFRHGMRMVSSSSASLSSEHVAVSATIDAMPAGLNALPITECIYYQVPEGKQESSSSACAASFGRMVIGCVVQDGSDLQLAAKYMPIQDDNELSVP